jgi:RNA polymerase sigma factor (sigma-70 family)
MEEKSNYVLPDNLSKYIDEYGKTKNNIIFNKILLLMDKLIFKMLYRIINKYKELQNVDSNDLYHTAIIVLEYVAGKYKIINDKSIFYFYQYYNGYLIKRLLRDYKLNSNIVDIDNNIDTYYSVSRVYNKIYYDDLVYLLENSDINSDIKMVLLYRYRDNLTYKEISNLCSIPIGNVSKRIHDGLRYFKKSIEI